MKQTLAINNAVKVLEQQKRNIKFLHKGEIVKGNTFKVMKQ